MDFITLHIYTCDVALIKSTVQGLTARYKRPIWITEFNCPNKGKSLEREISFMRSALEVRM